MLLRADGRNGWTSQQQSTFEWVAQGGLRVPPPPVKGELAGGGAARFPHASLRAADGSCHEKRVVVASKGLAKPT